MKNESVAQRMTREDVEAENRAVQFVPPPANPSGILPTEFKVVILPDEVNNEHKFRGQSGKEFKLYKPDDTTEREQFAQQDGVIVAVSGLAFTYATRAEWDAGGCSPPKAGDRVSFAKYAGATRLGKDGKTYRVVNDKDIIAVLA